jgi:RNA polymerase sigma factor (sigma-70 family)
MNQSRGGRRSDESHGDETQSEESQSGESRNRIIAWVGSEILPHEKDLRNWLRRSGSGEHDVDDIVQESYCRLASLKSVAHIASGRAYLFRTARNVAIERIRRARTVRIDYVTEIDSLNIVDNEPSPEQIVGSRRELRRVQGLIEGLPGRCRDIFVLRRIQGLPQREVAHLLGVTENVVEMQTIRGLKLILAALTDSTDNNRPIEAAAGHDRSPNRQRDR